MNWTLPSAVLRVSTALLAQTTSATGSAQGKVAGPDYFRMLGFGLTVVIAFLIIFYVIYPATLRRAVRIMPRTLYGRCLAFWLLAVEGLFLYLYWNQIVWGDQSLDINKYWPKAAWGVWMILTIVISLGYFRSARLVRPEASLPTDRPKTK